MKAVIVTLTLLAASVLGACGGSSRFSGQELVAPVPSTNGPSASEDTEEQTEGQVQDGMQEEAGEFEEGEESGDESGVAPDFSRRYETEVFRISWGSEDKQFADLYRPLNTDSPEALPVVIMIHGGCWSGFYDLSLQAALSSEIASRGVAVWNIEYRAMGTGGEWPVMFQDVADAADYLRHIAATQNIDLNRVYAMGHSAGGHLALWLASRSNIERSSPLFVAEPLALQKAVSLGGIPDLEAEACGSAPRNIIELTSLSGAARTARLATSSPLQMLPTNTSTILLSGASDTIAPPLLSEAYYVAALAAGDSSAHFTLEDADHFDLIDPDFLDMEWLLQSMFRNQ